MPASKSSCKISGWLHSTAQCTAVLLLSGFTSKSLAVLFAIFADIKSFRPNFVRDQIGKFSISGYWLKSFGSAKLPSKMLMMVSSPFCHATFQGVLPR